MRNSEHPKAFHLVLAQDNWFLFCSMPPLKNNSKQPPIECDVNINLVS